MRSEGYVRRLTRASGTSFYYAFLLLPRRQRQAIFALYAFSRRLDDTVDEEPDTARAAAALADWRRRLDELYAGRPEDPISEGLAEAVRAFDLPRSLLDELVTGVEMDLTASRYETWEELRTYCYRVASVVGLLCIEIFGYRHRSAREYAVHLGLAMQLTNILRDLRSDGLRGRLYLPREDLARFGVSEEGLLGGAYPAGYDRLLRFESDRALEEYARAAELLPPADRRSLYAAEIMGRIYRRLLLRMGRDGFRVMDRRYVVPRWEKAGIALSTYLRSRLARGPR
jgi:phytoene synthase